MHSHEPYNDLGLKLQAYQLPIKQERSIGNIINMFINFPPLDSCEERSEKPAGRQIRKFLHKFLIGRLTRYSRGRSKAVSVHGGLVDKIYTVITGSLTVSPLTQSLIIWFN